MPPEDSRDEDRAFGEESSQPFPEMRATSITADDRQWGMFCHLSALLGLVVGGLTIIGPLICWLVKKDQSPFVDYHGKESVNFQLNILVYSVIAFGITLATCFVAFPLMFVPVIYGVIMPIIAGMKANEGKYYEYPATVRVIK